MQPEVPPGHLEGKWLTRLLTAAEHAELSTLALDPDLPPLLGSLLAETGSPVAPVAEGTGDPPGLP
jgi:hypothetical protein